MTLVWIRLLVGDVTKNLLMAHIVSHAGVLINTRHYTVGFAISILILRQDRNVNVVLLGNIAQIA